MRAGELWSIVETNGKVGRDAYSLQTLRRYAQGGRWGLAFGAAVTCDVGGGQFVWVPLTEVGLPVNRMCLHVFTVLFH